MPPRTVMGRAGGSAQLRYEQLRRGDRARLDQRWGPFSGVVKFFSDEPQSTKAWAKGAAGERKLEDHLLRTVGEEVVMLHDRRIPGSKANIDHLVVASAGVWIVDAKSFKGRVEQRDVGTWRTPDKRLYVNGRDRSKLASGLIKQMNAVLHALDGLDLDIDIDVIAALCFVDSEWGLFAKPFLQGGVLVTRPTMLSKAVSEPGPLGRDEMATVAGVLENRLPAAVPIG
ncbi:MAG: nuclease-related domain-containing protein [Acidimicrobiales bacterium]